MVGVDEVGRGALAGPLLVVAARQTGSLPGGLRDSKLLSRKQRRAIFQLLNAKCQFGEGWVKPDEIDRLGLAGALRLGVKRALNGLNVALYEDIILDGKVNYLPKRFKRTRCLIDADEQVPIVSAASVRAKVRRDDYMFELAKKYPNYFFEQHVGYGTPRHLMALEKFGRLRRVHRFSFQPIAELAT